MPAQMLPIRDANKSNLSFAISIRALDYSLAFLTFLAGAFFCYFSRFTVNPDGVSYLDLGDAILRGDWHNAVNGYWSPLFPAIQGLALRLLHPSPYWESSVVHLVIFLLYVLALLAFRYYWNTLLRTMTETPEKASDLSSVAWLFTGYGIFVWTTAIMVGLNRVTPDICVVIAVVAASAISLTFLSSGRGYWAVALGIVLALGYLAKTILFPFAMMLLACIFLKAKRQSRKWVIAGAAVFLVIAAPWFVALSSAKHRLTFGDNSRLVYAWIVNLGIDGMTLNGAELPPGTPLIHPVRQLSSNPVVYEFATPISGTYPFWYDASYWLDGLRPRFEIHAQMRTLARNAILEARCPFPAVAVPLFLILLLSCRNRLDVLSRIANYWYLLVPCLGVVLLYALIFMLDRYLGPFFLVGATLAFGVAMKHGEFAPFQRAPLVITALMLASALGNSIRDVHRSATFSADRSQPALIADRLHSIGLKPGDQIAVVGHTYSCYWARLAGMRIVAETPVEYAPAFWSLAPEVRRQTEYLFQRAGAKAIVTDQMPRGFSTGGWQSLGVEPYYAYLLPK